MVVRRRDPPLRRGLVGGDEPLPPLSKLGLAAASGVTFRTTTTTTAAAVATTRRSGHLDPCGPGRCAGQVHRADAVAMGRGARRVGQADRIGGRRTKHGVAVPLIALLVFCLTHDLESGLVITGVDPADRYRPIGFRRGRRTRRRRRQTWCRGNRHRDACRRGAAETVADVVGKDIDADKARIGDIGDGTVGGR